MAHKNDYSVVVKSSEGNFLRWRFVHRLRPFFAFLDRQHSGWRYANVYDRRTGVQLASFTRKNRPTTDFL